MIPRKASSTGESSSANRVPKAGPVRAMAAACILPSQLTGASVNRGTNLIEQQAPAAAPRRPSGKRGKQGGLSAKDPESFQWAIRSPDSAGSESSTAADTAGAIRRPESIRPPAGARKAPRVDQWPRPKSGNRRSQRHTTNARGKCGCSQPAKISTESSNCHRRQWATEGSLRKDLGVAVVRWVSIDDFVDRCRRVANATLRPKR